MFVQSDPRATEFDRRIYRAERTVILQAGNYIEIIIWFAVLYNLWSNLFVSAGPQGMSVSTAPGALFYSVTTMTTLGYADIGPSNTCSAVLVAIQSLLGVFMALVIFTRFVALLPRFKTVSDRDLPSP
jgi:hypothetical protein